MKKKQRPTPRGPSADDKKALAAYRKLEAAERAANLAVSKAQREMAALSRVHQHAKLTRDIARDALPAGVQGTRWVVDLGL